MKDAETITFLEDLTASIKKSKESAAEAMHKVASEVHNAYGSDHELTKLASSLYLKLCREVSDA